MQPAAPWRRPCRISKFGPDQHIEIVAVAGDGEERIEILLRASAVLDADYVGMVCENLRSFGLNRVPGSRWDVVEIDGLGERVGDFSVVGDQLSL